MPDEMLQLLPLLLLAPCDDELEVDCDDCDEPKISENGRFSSIGDGNPRLMISLCSSSELIECFCSISGPVSDRAISGLGQSLKLVCCSEGISPFRYSVSFALLRRFSLPETNLLRRRPSCSQIHSHLHTCSHTAPQRYNTALWIFTIRVHCNNSLMFFF